MSKTHFVSLTAMPPSWDGLEIKVLCGASVKDVRPVFRLDFQNFTAESVSSLAFCKVCFPLAVLPVDGRQYVVGVLPAEEALRLRAGHEEEL